MNKDFKDIIVRMLKTFIQGFLGALVVTLPNNDFNDLSFAKPVLIGAVAGGISAVMNLVLALMKKEEEEVGKGEE